MPADNKAIVRRFYEEVWIKRRLEIVNELISPSHALQGPNIFGSSVGPEAYKRQVSNLLEAYPDLRWTIEDTIAEKDKVVACWTFGHPQRKLHGSSSDKQESIREWNNHSPYRWRKNY